MLEEGQDQYSKSESTSLCSAKEVSVSKLPEQECIIMGAKYNNSSRKTPAHALQVAHETGVILRMHGCQFTLPVTHG